MAPALARLLKTPDHRPPEGRRHVDPPLWMALVPVAALIILVVLCLQLLDLGFVHFALIGGAAMAVGMGMVAGRSYADMERGIVHGISLVVQPILILMTVGILVSTWIASGIVPLLIYWGLELISPAVFLPASCIICAAVSMSIGSSWTTAATVGVALIAVGTGMGFWAPVVAGSVISGAYFGDKMSPLSDTTNLASGVVHVNLFTHIRNMVPVSGPAIVLALIGFLLLGIFLPIYGSHGGYDAKAVSGVQEALTSMFSLSPLLLLGPALVVAHLWLRVATLPTLLAGALAGVVLALVFQEGASLSGLLNAAMSGFQVETDDATLNELLSKGGLESMMWTVALIICALAFGGAMERAGFLASIARSVLKLAKGAGSLMASSVGTCFAMNTLAADQYLAIVVPGRMYSEAFRRKGLHPKNLSRTLEDAGTLTSPLIAYNTCGAFMSGALGVSPADYWLFCFFNILNPLLSIVFAFAGWQIHKLDETEEGAGVDPATYGAETAGKV